jgi:hypothetical protein
MMFDNLALYIRRGRGPWHFIEEENTCHRFSKAPVISFPNWLTFKPLNTYYVTDLIDRYIGIYFN